MSTMYKITPEVCTTDNKCFIVRIDSEECCFVDSKAEALRVVESLTEAKIREFESPSKKVFREGNEDCYKVITQSLGYLYNGEPHIKCTIDYVEVPRAIVAKDRIALDKKVAVNDLVASEDENPSLPEAIKTLYGMQLASSKKVETKEEAKETDSKKSDSSDEKKKN